MALLTEEQIKQLLAITSNQSTSKDLHDELCEWNKKQTTQQIEPDWSKASDNVISAVVHVTWVTKLGTWVGSYPVATFDRPAPVIIPHPHAEIMAKYAEVAARRVDPWVEFELCYCDEDWIVLETPTFFDTHLKYRHIGDDK